MRINLPQRNKYGAKKTVYKGRTYHSKREAAYAWELDQRVKNGEIISWIPQVRIPLLVNSQRICTYVCDFSCIMADGHTRLVEVKGYQTAVYKLKRKLLEVIYLKEHPDIEYVVLE